MLKADKSVVPALKTMTADTRSNPLARIHALWTLEGLGALDTALVRTLLKDSDPQIRIQALRASETLYKAGEKTLADDYVSMAKDKDTDVVIQSLLTLNTMKVADAKGTIQTAFDTNKTKGVQLVANTILHPELFAGAIGGLDRLAVTTFTPEEQAVMEKGQTIYKEVCFACHGDDGRGTPAPGLRDTRSAARVFAAGARPSRLRDQSAAQGAHGPHQRRDVPRRDGVDGPEQRRVGRRNRVVRAQLVRQPRNGHRAVRRRARAHLGRRPKGSVARPGAGIDAAASHRAGSVVEGDGEPQHGDRRQRLRHPAMDVG